jgi:type III secretory pathway component EscR
MSNSTIQETKDNEIGYQLSLYLLSNRLLKEYKEYIRLNINKEPETFFTERINQLVKGSKEYKKEVVDFCLKKVCEV